MAASLQSYDSPTLQVEKLRFWVTAELESGPQRHVYTYWATPGHQVALFDLPVAKVLAPQGHICSPVTLWTTSGSWPGST